MIRTLIRDVYVAGRTADSYLGPSVRETQQHLRRSSMSAFSSPGSQQNIARPIALILGVVYLAAGVIGFAATGFHGFVTPHGDSFLGFPINIFHNIVHIGIGAFLIVAARLPDATMTQGILLGVGIVYVAATLLGFLGKLPIIAVTSAGNPDNFLHLASAAVAVIGGLAGAAQQHDADAAFGR
jgi:hypothetical protein